MFFWIMIASLIGLLSFGNLHEKTKDDAFFVTPVYEAMALGTYQQHVSVEAGLLDAMRQNPTAANNYINGFADGIVPLAGASGGALSGIYHGDNPLLTYFQARLPPMYKPQNGTRTYLICVDKPQVASQISCSAADAVKYIITVRAVPPRYDGVDRMAALHAVSMATGHSRFVGFLAKAAAPLDNSTGQVRHQPLGSAYYLMTAGVAPVNSVYLPNYATCNFPTGGSSVLGDMLGQRTYIAALTLFAGLQPNENMPAGTPGICPAVTYDN